MRRLALRILLRAWVIVALAIVPGWCANPPLAAQVPKQVRRIELTQSDLAGEKDWKSTDISIAGFRLGMTRDEARANAGQSGLLLLPMNVGVAMSFQEYLERGCFTQWCDVYTCADLPVSLEIRFNEKDVADRISIPRVPEDADPGVRRSSIARRFKGETYALFTHYTDEARLKLFGTETLRKDIPPAQGSPLAHEPKYWDRIYSYTQRGVAIYVSPNSHGPEWTSDLTVTFSPPE